MSKAGAPADVNDQKAIQESPADVSNADKEQQKAVADYSKTANDQLSMRVRVHSPFKDYYDGLAFSLTAESATGPFDILPKHHNFISLLQSCDLVVRSVSQGERRIHIAGGLIHVKADEIVIFLDV